VDVVVVEVAEATGLNVMAIGPVPPAAAEVENAVMELLPKVATGQQLQAVEAEVAAVKVVVVVARTVRAVVVADHDLIVPLKERKAMPMPLLSTEEVRVRCTATRANPVRNTILTTESRAPAVANAIKGKVAIEPVVLVRTKTTTPQLKVKRPRRRRRK